mmetsp:Transcript_31262/g.101971  ORF Transcript_31262/g.101971 Transcript_31262/m.101971 type:complete len:389 (-) Transcript_31262:1602-2768(-)
MVASASRLPAAAAAASIDPNGSACPSGAMKAPSPELATESARSEPQCEHFAPARAMPPSSGGGSVARLISSPACERFTSTMGAATGAAGTGAAAIRGAAVMGAAAAAMGGAAGAAAAPGSSLMLSAEALSTTCWPSMDLSESARAGSSMATSGTFAWRARSARCERCGSGWQSTTPARSGPAADTSSSPPACSRSTTKGPPVVGSLPGSRAASVVKVPAAVPVTRQSQPCAPVSARTRRSRSEHSLDTWNTTDARISPSVSTATLWSGTPSAGPSALARPSKRSETRAQNPSETRRARSAHACERMSTSSRLLPPVSNAAASASASRAIAADSPGSTPDSPALRIAAASAESAADHAPAPHATSAPPPTPASASAPSALSARLKSTKA